MSSGPGNSLLGSVFGRGTIYENLDAVDEEEETVGTPTPVTFQTRPARPRQGGEIINSDSEDDDYQPAKYTEDEAPTESLYRAPPEPEPEVEDDIPASLMVEQRPELSPVHDFGGGPSKLRGAELPQNRPPTIASPQLRRPAADPQAENLLPLYSTHSVAPANSVRNLSALHLDPKEKALWKWANVDNLDLFLQEVYNYFLGNGIYCIILNRLLNMATLVFVVGFSTYLGSCIDYSKLSTSSKLSDVQVERCMAHMGGFHKLLLWCFALFWFMKLFQYASDIRKLVDLHNFYLHLLGISDTDMQTISWQHVVSRIVLLKDQNLATATRTFKHTQHNDPTANYRQKLDPHGIANRIMRKENYLIAMINKNVLDFSTPVPLLAHKQLLTRTLEWNISLCVMDYAFNQDGQLRPIFLKESHRRLLSDGLRRRFMFAGCMNIVCAPFIIVYLALLYFFRYFNEYHRDPSSIGTRQYTPLAEWRMRELNELYHLFQRRLNMSHPAATRYINQFPREKTVSLLRFVAFVAGSFAAVLGIISLVDPELFLGFELSPDRTVLFYIGIFGSIVAISRSMIPNETLVFDPETSMKYVAEFTHYLPKEWEGRLHSDWVKGEFSTLYDLKIMVIFTELLSVIISPFILWFSLPKSCDRIIDFFREYSVHVDGLGYVCSQAMFNFEKPEAKERKYGSGDDKMLKSYLNFVDNYGEGDPNFNLRRRDPESHSRFRNEFSVPGGKAPPSSNLDHSVMGRYQRMQGTRQIPDSLKSVSVDPHKVFDGGGLSSGIFGDRANESFESTFGLNDTREEDTADTPGDGGVLGLINQFYKQTDTNTRHMSLS